MVSQNFKVMVISTQRWPIPARISSELAGAGFAVGAISPSRSFVRQTRAVHRHYTYFPWAPIKSIVRAIEDWSPDFLVCTDDQALRELHSIHSRGANSPVATRSKRLAALIETSIG